MNTHQLEMQKAADVSKMAPLGLSAAWLCQSWSVSSKKKAP